MSRPSSGAISYFGIDAAPWLSPAISSEWRYDRTTKSRLIGQTLCITLRGKRYRDHRRCSTGFVSATSTSAQEAPILPHCELRCQRRRKELVIWPVLDCASLKRYDRCRNSSHHRKTDCQFIAWLLDVCIARAHPRRGKRSLADELYLDAVQFPAKCNGELVAVGHHSSQRGRFVFSTSRIRPNGVALAHEDIGPRRGSNRRVLKTDLPRWRFE